MVTMSMKDFVSQVDLVVKELNSIGYLEEAKSLENSLRISNSSLEILGETRKQLLILKNKKILRKLSCDSTIEQLNAYIAKYWPGY